MLIFCHFTSYRGINQQIKQLIPLTKVFAELFSKSDRVPPRHTNNPELAKYRMYSYSPTHHTPTKNRYNPCKEQHSAEAA